LTFKRGRLFGSKSATSYIIDGHTNQEPIGIDDLRLAHEHDHYGRVVSKTEEWGLGFGGWGWGIREVGIGG